MVVMCIAERLDSNDELLRMIVRMASIQQSTVLETVKVTLRDWNHVREDGTWVTTIPVDTQCTTISFEEQQEEQQEEGSPHPNHVTKCMLHSSPGFLHLVQIGVTYNRKPLEEQGVVASDVITSIRLLHVNPRPQGSGDGILLVEQVKWCEDTGFTRATTNISSTTGSLFDRTRNWGVGGFTDYIVEVMLTQTIQSVQYTTKTNIHCTHLEPWDPGYDEIHRLVVSPEITHQQCKVFTSAVLTNLTIQANLAI